VRVNEWSSEQAKRIPDTPFVVSDQATITYGDAERAIRRRAGYLRQVIEPGELVGVVASSTVGAVVTMLAVPRAGGILLPIGAALTGSEVTRLCRRLGAKLIDAQGPDGPEIEPHEADPSRPVAVFATSGSTGVPKGVVLTAGNLLASAEASASFLGHRSGDRWLAVMPLNHVGGFSILTRSMHVGGTVVLEPRFDPERTASLLHGVEFASLVPSMLSRIMTHAEGPFERLRTVLVGGGPLAPGLLEAANDLGIPAVPTYGTTETAAQVATGRPGARAVTPLPGVSIRIDRGEIVVEGPMVSPGYWRQTPRVGPYHTGDAGTVDDEGNLVVLGRLDDMVITGGENVYPTEVEAVLSEHPEIVDVAVTGVDDERWGRALRAVVVAPSLDEAEVVAWARDRLASYKVPKQWSFVDQIPRTDLGKPKRSEQ
jgi:O-succinylbenzoic acid--CoA ligase